MFLLGSLRKVPSACLKNTESRFDSETATARSLAPSPSKSSSTASVDPPWSISALETSGNSGTVELVSGGLGKGTERSVATGSSRTERAACIGRTKDTMMTTSNANAAARRNRHPSNEKTVPLLLYDVFGKNSPASLTDSCPTLK